MRVVVTGVTSYTGACIAAAFAGNGAQVSGLCRRNPGDYGGLARRRLDVVRAAGVTLVGGLPVESHEFSSWLGEAKIDLWIHHHHPMERFRAVDYDVASAERVALEPLGTLVPALARAGCRGIIYSSTYFEPGEGGQAPTASVTPYAALKRRVYERLAELCQSASIATGRVVIPSPTGALENADRLTPLFLESARRHQPFVVRSPESVMDMIPGEFLGNAYVAVGAKLLAGQAAAARPSGLVITTRKWLETVGADIAEQLGLRGAIEVPEPPAPPVYFRNSDPVMTDADWDGFAARYAQSVREM
jgi:UDP-glucose 4-epimerase